MFDVAFAYAIRICLDLHDVQRALTICRLQRKGVFVFIDKEPGPGRHANIGTLC